MFRYALPELVDILEKSGFLPALTPNQRIFWQTLLGSTSQLRATMEIMIMRESPYEGEEHA